jgi:hypothetical protein
VRDDRPFAGSDPPAAVFFYSPDRGGEHPERHLADYAGLMQTAAYAGFSRLYEANRKLGPIVEAACWAHGRRKFFDLARLTKAGCSPGLDGALLFSFAILRWGRGTRSADLGAPFMETANVYERCLAPTRRSVKHQPAVRGVFIIAKDVLWIGLLQRSDLAHNVGGGR